MIMIINRDSLILSCATLTDIYREASHLWSELGKEGTRWTVVEWWEGWAAGAGGGYWRDALPLRQTPLASACYNWQVVQAVRRRWGTTYHHNWIIYFLRQDAEMAPFTLSFKPPPRLTVSLMSVCICPWKKLILLRRWKHLYLTSVDDTTDDFCSKSQPLFFIRRESQANLALGGNEAQR